MRSVSSGVLAIIADARYIDTCIEEVGIRYAAHITQATDYSAFGAPLPGRTWYSTTSYRYGINTQEKDNDVFVGAYTAQFWEYDSRLGRRWNQDPKTNPTISNYAVFTDNPIFYTDVLGDVVRGVNATSGTRMRDVIKNSFQGDNASNLRSLFKLDADGKTISKIKESDFVNAISGLTSDQQQLAYGYFNAINSNEVQTVEMIYRDEKLSSTAQEKLVERQEKTGADVDYWHGGGVNMRSKDGKSTFSVIVMDNVNAPKDYVGRSNDGISYKKTSSPGELLAHEMLGHGLGGINGSKTSRHEDAIQMTNLYLRVQGQVYYRNGTGHGPKVLLSESDANRVPVYIQLPQNMQDQINICNLRKEINNYRKDWNKFIPLGTDNSSFNKFP